MTYLLDAGLAKRKQIMVK